MMLVDQAFETLKDPEACEKAKQLAEGVIRDAISQAH